MRIEDLELFSDIVHYHSMTIAAEKHFMTSQNISRIIKNLEDELGVVLFSRSRKGAELTEIGEQVYLQVGVILAEYRKLGEIAGKRLSETEEQTKSNRDAGIKVLCHQGLTYYATMQAYYALRKTAEYNLQMELENLKFCKSDKLLEHLQENEYNLMLINIYGNDELEKILTKQDVYMPKAMIKDEFVLMVSEKHPYANRKIVSVSEFPGLSFALVKDGFINRELLADIKPAFVIDSMNSLIDEVKNSDTLCTIVNKKLFRANDRLWDSRLKFIPIDKKLYITVMLLVNNNSIGDVAVEEYANQLELVLSSDE